MNGATRERNDLGALLIADGAQTRCEFRVWAPAVEAVSVRLFPQSGGERLLQMVPADRGYFELVVDDVRAGDRYFYRLDAEGSSVDRPDPASRLQVEGVHGPSQVVSCEFPWTDGDWTGVDLADCIFYELHIGTFTDEGTFDAAIAQLDALRALGVTVIEIMPVAQFPGSRNWGYDGVLPFAVQHSYGGPDGLKRLVNACHERGLAVALDVVYNHLGPEGNYLSQFGSYFTEKYHTPWGRAMNFDGPGSDEVRRYFLQNALMWVREFHMDALRLDAVHAMVDQSAYPFLHELTDTLHDYAAVCQRPVHVIAESDLNDPRLIRSPARGGYGMDAQWSDDLHHALHALLTGESDGYYADFGSAGDLAVALSDGYVYQGQYSHHRQCRHGAPTGDAPARHFVVCAQNHDQVGNRAMGDRLRTLVSFVQYRLAAAVNILSPFLPLLFMGEEYAERNPFLYFISHSDPQLVEAVRTGRRGEFASFAWKGEVPDPQATDTFERSKLNRAEQETAEGRAALAWYGALLHARRSNEPLSRPDRRRQVIRCDEAMRTMAVHRWGERQHVLLAFNFSDAHAEARVEVPSGAWELMLHSGERRFQPTKQESPLSRTLNAASEVAVPLEPYAFGLYAQQAQAG